MDVPRAPAAMTPRGQAFDGSFDAPTAAILPSRDVTHVHLLRHGDVVALAQRGPRGQRDVPLSAEGVRQSERLAAWLCESEPAPTHVFASDLQRCRDLGARIAETFGLPLVTTRALREQSLGDWEGRSWAELSADDPAGVTAYWERYHAARPPGGESLADLSARVSAWWDASEPGVRGGRVVVATHIGVIRAWLCVALGLGLDQALRFAPATGSHTALLHAQAGAVLASFGERPWAADAVRAARAHGPPRIGLSGSAGTGKTTLGRRLAGALGVPFIEEGMRARLHGGLRLHELSAPQVRRLHAELWDEHRAQVDAAWEGGFVADRTSADFAAFWLHYGFTDPVDETDARLAAFRDALPRYERILLFPWGVIPLVADGTRAPNPWTQFRYQAMVEGVLRRQAAPGQVVDVPPVDDLDVRLRTVLALVRD